MTALLVAIEGIDGVGKGTQAALLLDRAAQYGANIKTISFPQYTKTIFSKSIADFLNGRFGQLNEVSPYMAALLFAGDRLESKGMLIDAINHQDVVILDRYVWSNVVYQSARVEDHYGSSVGQGKDRFVEWLLDIEFGAYGLPVPDLTVLLDAPTEIAFKNIEMKRKEDRIYTDNVRDIFEKDKSDLEMYRQTYKNIIGIRGSRWEQYNCLDMGSGLLKNADDISRDIWSIIEKTLIDFRH